MTTREDDSTRRTKGELRSFGRRKGRKLSERQNLLLGETLQQVAINLSSPLPGDLRHLFPGQESNLNRVWLEIGFGGGEHLLALARANADVGLIGCEPFVDGVVKVLDAVAHEALRNLIIHADDARPLLRALPDASLDRVFILYPDPWPKKRHHKRRLFSRQTLDLLARVMKPGGELLAATDIGSYASVMLRLVKDSPHFAWTAERPGDWRSPPQGWTGTRYEAKALREGRRPIYLRFERLPS